MNEQHYVKRFGVIAVEKGLITPDQLQEAIKIQIEENLGKNEHRFIGTILHSLGYISRQEIIEVLEAIELEKLISEPETET